MDARLRRRKLQLRLLTTRLAADRARRRPNESRMRAADRQSRKPAKRSDNLSQWQYSGNRRQRLLSDRGLERVEAIMLETPFGPPSDSYYRGWVGDTEVIFLSRHGRGHRILPSELNYRANIHGMKQLGVEHLVSVSTAGSMKETIAPGDLVVPDQFIDHTYARRPTFFGDGIVGHVSLADPVCADLSHALVEASRATGAKVHEGGTYLCIEGPQFSTRAESTALSKLGRRRDQHDRDAGGATRTRSRALLRGADAGHRL